MEEPDISDGYTTGGLLVAFPATSLSLPLDPKNPLKKDFLAAMPF